MSRALPGIQVVSQIACPVQAKKKVEKKSKELI